MLTANRVIPGERPFGRAEEIDPKYRCRYSTLKIER
jgi:hypothetical protein